MIELEISLPFVTTIHPTIANNNINEVTIRKIEISEYRILPIVLICVDSTRVVSQKVLFTFAIAPSELPVEKLLESESVALSGLDSSLLGVTGLTVVAKPQTTIAAKGKLDLPSVASSDVLMLINIRIKINNIDIAPTYTNK